MRASPPACPMISTVEMSPRRLAITPVSWCRTPGPESARTVTPNFSAISLNTPRRPRLSCCVSDHLARPQPAEGARRQQRVDQAIHRPLERGEPGAAVPDGHRPERRRVGEEGGDADEPEYAQVMRNDTERTPRHVRREDADAD